MESRDLLGKLPPFTNKTVTIRRNQTVGDIVNEVLTAHRIFASDYDAIALEFDKGDNVEIAKKLFDFLKRNVRYKVESEEKQTTKSPAAILETAQGDCKHYAGFVAGVLDALRRAGKKIDWHYRFASYSILDTLPGHVFVVLNENGKEYWIDPVLKTFNEKLQPSYILDKKINTDFMLQRLSGIGEALPPEAYYFDEEDADVDPNIMNAITVLYQYGLLNTEGQVNDARIIELSTTLPQEEFNKISQARTFLYEASINGFFSGIWKGVKKVTLSVPRNAYLSLVAINAFGLATKLGNALYNLDGSYYQPGKDKLKSKWEKLGGNFSKLENTIKTGMRKKAILGNTIGNPAIPAWVAVASALIAALAPIIKEVLQAKAQAGQLQAGIDPMTGLPYGMNDQNLNQDSGNGIMAFIQDNPFLVIAVAAGAVYFLTDKKKKTA